MAQETKSKSDTPIEAPQKRNDIFAFILGIDFRDKRVVAVLGLLAFLAVVAGFYFVAPERLYRFIGIIPPTEKRIRIIEENLNLPNTERVSSGEGRIVSDGAVDVPLVQNEEEVIVPMAELTLKGAYDAVLPYAKSWASDAKLVFIKSLGAVMINGKSSQWQVIFGSQSKKNGYEIIVRGKESISRKEIESGSFGFDLPQNWYDSGEAIKSLQLPQFGEATISSLSFYYNIDGKRWSYAIATSRGTTAMPVQ